MQPPATDAQLHSLAERGQQLPYVFPTAYLEVLGEVNGIDSNGIMLYSTEPQALASQPNRLDSLLEGVIEANLLWREDAANAQYIFFAESGERLYGQNLATQN
ncbi:MAG: hypothetical protein EOO60_02850 [Hymenobacter sp.]|nr:MAG: hypothetical protein EOO60_02850 [Hymenobacter sp.]